ncbi:unnamed protein product [Agarophyton chilense]
MFARVRRAQILAARSAQLRFAAAHAANPLDALMYLRCICAVSEARTRGHVRDLATWSGVVCLSCAPYRYRVVALRTLAPLLFASLRPFVAAMGDGVLIERDTGADADADADADAELHSIVSRALRYPYHRPSGAFTFVNGTAQPYTPPPHTTHLHVVLAIGSNAAPEQLRRKFGTQRTPVHVLPARLHGLDVVYAAMLAPYGSIPATLALSEHTVAHVHAMLLPSALLPVLHASESGYLFVRLRRTQALRAVLPPDHIPCLSSLPIFAYVARLGPLHVHGAPVALAEIVARQRRFVPMPQRQAMECVRTIVRDELPLSPFVAENRAVSFDNVSAFASIPSFPDTPPDAGPAALAAARTHSPATIATKKLCIVMVGLPARGKTHIARCLERYLNWLGFSAAVFNVGNYRRMILGPSQSAHFFSPDNLEGYRARMEVAIECLTDMMAWFSRGGMVGLYDATNSTKKRRKMVKDRLEAVGVRVLFLESLCTDPAIIEKNILETKLRSPDYKHKDPEEAVLDFKKRIQLYDKANETVDDSENCSYIKIINVGRQIILNHIQGFAQGKIVSFLLNSHITPRSIYLSRHGESEWNVTGQLGGDPDLTPRGRSYAQRLAKFINTEFPQKGKDMPLVWTSQLRRTRRTVECIPTVNHSWRALNEIDAGVCEGMTYKSIAEQMPDIAGERKKDKLRYRYPGGESYVDVIYRLEPLILELERQRGPVLIVAHNAVIRAIYAYFMRISQEECPYINIPLHTVFKLTTRAYGAEEEIFPMEVAHTDQNRTPESGDSDGGDDAPAGQTSNTEPLTNSLKSLAMNGVK